jgi:hypothetical protein
MIFSSLLWLLHVHSAVNRSCLIMYVQIAGLIRGGRQFLLKRSPENFKLAVKSNYDSVTAYRRI